ncbi:hypothetical protein [Xanthomonas arboricola]|uniref:hypothetical protein n=1 Tax=Xanthomonas arboricola TaxID=56448 RepID=UPI0011AFFC6D|nr:hypothetical protein [Xanthomonas arboricola]
MAADEAQGRQLRDGTRPQHEATAKGQVDDRSDSFVMRDVSKRPASRSALDAVAQHYRRLADDWWCARLVDLRQVTVKRACSGVVRYAIRFASVSVVN